jgi:CRP-like cAMP-binding protein
MRAMSSLMAVDAEEQERLLSRYGRRFKLGEVLFHDGDLANEAFLLQEGRVRLIKRVGASERSLRVLRPGDLFGETALLKHAPRSSTALALDDGVALALDQATFQHVLGQNPEVGTRVMQQLVRRLRDAEDQVELLMVQGAQSKIIVALLKLIRQAAREDGGSPSSVQLSVSPMELSSQVGLDVDTVKRTVFKLREREYVNIVDERIEIQDVEALRELYGVLGVKDEILGGSLVRGEQR